MDQIQNASDSAASSSSSSSSQSFNSVNGLSNALEPLVNEDEQTTAKHLADFFQRNPNAAPPATNHRNSQPMILSAVEHKEKKKALHVPISMLQIGNFRKVSAHEGDLVAKCYYARAKVMWEILEGHLKNKIEFKWENILSLRAKFGQNGRGTLMIELKERPSFFHEMDPKPRKHTNWESSWDFTRNQASTYRLHMLEFSSHILEEFYTKLIESDSRLNELSKGPCPTLSSPYFTSNGYDVRGPFTSAPPPLHVAQQVGNQIQEPNLVQVSPLHRVNNSQRQEDSADHMLATLPHRFPSNGHGVPGSHPSFHSSRYAAFPSNINIIARGSISHSHLPSGGHDACGSQSHPHFLSDGHDAYGSQSHPHFLSNGRDAYGSESYLHDAHGSQSHPHFSSNEHDAHGSQSDPYFLSNDNDAYGSQSNTHFPSDGNDAHGSLLHPHFSSNGRDAHGSQSHLRFPSNVNETHESPSHPHYGSPHPSFRSNGYDSNGSSTCTQMQPKTPVQGIDNTISPLHEILFYRQGLEDPNLTVSRDPTTSSVNPLSMAALEALGNEILSDSDTNSKVEGKPAQNVNTNRCHALPNASQEQHQNHSRCDANANFHSYRQPSGEGGLIHPQN